MQFSSSILLAGKSRTPNFSPPIRRHMEEKKKKKRMKTKKEKKKKKTKKEKKKEKKRVPKLFYTTKKLIEFLFLTQQLLSIFPSAFVLRNFLREQREKS